MAQSGQVYTELQHSSSHLPRVRLQFKAQHQNTKTGRAGLDLRKTLDIRRTFDIRKFLDLRKATDIRKILPLLVGCSRTHEVSKEREDKAGRPVLDAEEVTVSPSTNAKA